VIVPARCHTRGVPARWSFALPFVVLACAPQRAPSPPPPPPGVPAATAGALRPPAAFAAIADRAARSRALFAEVSRVLGHARCVNCHPDDDTPRQGEAGAPHDPPVWRGAEGRGVPGLGCATCHQDRNAELARIPGAPTWQLAPRSMAWLGKPAGAICAQLKDPARNGGRSLAQVLDHVAHDAIVAWGWQPGADRARPPGSQAELAALVAAWIESGAACPAEEAR
jgi:hypothetical protein